MSKGSKGPSPSAGKDSKVNPDRGAKVIVKDPFTDKWVGGARESEIITALNKGEAIPPPSETPNE